MSKFLKNKKGFTLIELMIVVAIIGILAAIAIPNYLNYQCKAKQTEARSILGALRTAQESYYAEYSTYAADTGAMNFEIKGGGDYAFTVPTSGATGFTAQARSADINGTVDKWTVNSTGTFTNVTPACD